MSPHGRPCAGLLSARRRHWDPALLLITCLMPTQMPTQSDSKLGQTRELHLHCCTNFLVIYFEIINLFWTNWTVECGNNSNQYCSFYF